MTSTPITTADIAKGKIDDALSVREKNRLRPGDAGGTVITCLIMNFHLFLHRRFWLNSGAGRHAVYCTARV